MVERAKAIHACNGQGLSTMEESSPRPFNRYHSGTNMDRLTKAATLDPKYFEKHADFKDDYKLDCHQRATQDGGRLEGSMQVGPGFREVGGG